MREALSAVRNLEQLLKNVRVGPRALTSVIPDVHSSFASVGDRVEEILGALEQRLDDTSVVAELRDYVVPRVRELVDALDRARDKPMTAKLRLGLEDRVERVANELDAARGLIDMLDGAAWGRGGHFNLVDLVRESFRVPEDEPPPGPALELSSTAPELELLVNPRVAAMLLALCVAWVAERAPTSPTYLTISDQPGGGCRVRIATDGPAGERLHVDPQLIISPALSCARAATRLTGGELTEHDGGLELVWPAAAS